MLAAGSNRPHHSPFKLERLFAHLHFGKGARRLIRTSFLWRWAQAVQGNLIISPTAQYTSVSNLNTRFCGCRPTMILGLITVHATALQGDSGSHPSGRRENPLTTALLGTPRFIHSASPNSIISIRTSIRTTRIGEKPRQHAR